MLVSECIAGFLKARRAGHNGPDLLDRWTPAMETQVNVAAGKGEPVDGKKGTYTDGVNEWWNIRMPKQANSDPYWNDYRLTWPLLDHAEAIGCTGWDWVARESRWLGFDFDSLTSHAAGVGISDEQLAAVRDAAQAVPWIEVRRSTGGAGLHLYAHVSGIKTANHTEHAALGRAILAMLSSEAGFDFASQVDVCGGNMWIWHRKMTAANGGLSLLKPATRDLTERDVPANWLDHADVVTRKRAKVRVRGVTDEKEFEALASSRKAVPLDDQHKALMLKLAEYGHSSVWMPDYHLLQTHTLGLAQIAEEGGIKGLFKTLSSGSTPVNCFAFPMPDGGWSVYRFSQGVKEADTWEQGSGYTWCYFNCLPTLAAACKAMGGDKLAKGKGYQFDRAEDALKAVELLGETLSIPDNMLNRIAVLAADSDGSLTATIRKLDGDTKPGPGWADKKTWWEKVCGVGTAGAATTGDAVDDYDHLVRVVVTPQGTPAGTYVATASGVWSPHNTSMVKYYLQSNGYAKAIAEDVLGQAMAKCWYEVTLPFQPEYPGGRKWNRFAPQLRVNPATYGDDLCHPHWDRVFSHCGQTLTPALRELAWAKAANIVTGGDYLRAWFACILREPFEPLPYLFLCGDENSGKSILWEAFDHCLVNRGVAKADRVLLNAGDFNGELLGAILCVIEEKNVTKAGAHNRIKDYVTGRKLAIRRMRTDAYSVPNLTHWIQCSNEADACPVFAGDTRITVLHVPTLPSGSEIPKRELLEALTHETPAFLRTLLDLQLPAASGRLRIPVVETEHKRDLAAENSSVAQFFTECCSVSADTKVAKAKLFESYESWCRDNHRAGLDLYSFGREFKPLVKGKARLTKVELNGKRVDGWAGLKLTPHYAVAA